MTGTLQRTQLEFLKTGSSGTCPTSSDCLTGLMVYGFRESRRDVEKVAGGGAPRNPRASGPPYDRAPEVRQKRWYDMRRRSPKKALIVFHQPAPEELEIFFLKRMPPMMLFLVEHVMPGGFKARGVNGERAISILPGERGTFL